ncbi:hypothetical protein GCM10010251_90370 [Streptomyces aurantiogriseus]|uniref:Uncharacterized protein n=1 Tax=Streptomyces aurantiogriseus TaxID=66870 RepID=A0A918KZU1_9ACTN|nr:hypothetical protein GCM10010251_90370 [Streptomyces aurantiogriseus]
MFPQHGQAGAKRIGRRIRDGPGKQTRLQSGVLKHHHQAFRRTSPGDGGLLLRTVLTVFSPIVSGSEFTLWPEASFNWYPFQTPGLVSVPAAFALGWLGTVSSPEGSRVDFEHMHYRILTGKTVGPQTADPQR